VLGLQLDWMIFRVFSNLIDYMILREQKWLRREQEYSVSFFLSHIWKIKHMNQKTVNLTNSALLRLLKFPRKRTGL